MIRSPNKILVIALFLTTIIGIYQILHKDFWFDEAYTYQVAKLPISSLLKATLSDNNPPLFFLLIHFLVKASQDPAFLRIPSLISQLLTTILIFKIVKQQFSPKLASLAAIAFSISPLTLYLASEARPHSIAIFTSVLTTYYFLKIIRSPSRSNIFMFQVIFTIGLYTQYYLALLLLPFTFLVLKNKFFSNKQWSIIALAPLILLVPLLISSLNYGHVPCYCPPTYIALLQTLISPTSTIFGSLSTTEYFKISPLITITSVATSALLLYLFLNGLRKNPFSLHFLLPLFFLSIIGIFMPVFSPKGFAVFFPFYLITALRGLKKKADSKLDLGLVLIAFLLLSTILQLIYPQVLGKRIHDAFKATVTNPQAMIIHTSVLTYYSFIFYGQNPDRQILLGQNPLPDTIKKLTNTFPGQIPIDNTSLWLIDTQKWTNPTQRKATLNILNRNYSSQTKSQAGTLSVIYLVKK